MLSLCKSVDRDCTKVYFRGGFMGGWVDGWMDVWMDGYNVGVG
jgi:hypothetical protein